ncbi:hypothetical protein BCR36DRAFT_588058 [Piromyces finnis]|uniref:Uncharacterized protein n=1 Tax=Piromyces finnis TaxID=1754191 RepID=A0A1Y1UW22_9FUNG|nr:hypothetical protein BCR36DRAFT_588058 [Piromyces finnis]|eukprot:ORX41425.1 hypothetical protein BCR36DRAFT_588058 [Piromyces finnis]
MYISIEDEIRAYLKDKDIDHLTEQQIQRLSSYLFYNSVNVLMDEAKPSLNNNADIEVSIKEKIIGVLESEQKKFEKQNNSDEIGKILVKVLNKHSNNEKISNDEKTTLYNYLQTQNEILDNDDIDRILSSTDNSDSLSNDIKNKIHKVINSRKLNYEAIHDNKFYNRESHFPFSDKLDNNGYVKVDNIDLLVKCEFVLRNRDEEIHVPQVNKIEFGNSEKLNDIEGYRFTNSENTFNRRGIAKNLAQNDLTVSGKLNILNPGKNLNLNTHLEELANTIENGRLVDIPLSNPNHWLLNHLQNNLGKIYVDTHNLLNKLGNAEFNLNELNKIYNPYIDNNNQNNNQNDNQNNNQNDNQNNNKKIKFDKNTGKLIANYRNNIADNLLNIHSVLHDNLGKESDRINAKKDF